jgi:hypothetical protein
MGLHIENGVDVAGGDGLPVASGELGGGFHFRAVLSGDQTEMRHFLLLAMGGQLEAIA